MKEIYIGKNTQKIIKIINNITYIPSFLFDFICFLFKQYYITTFDIFIFIINKLNNIVIYLKLSILYPLFNKYLFNIKNII